MNKDLNRKNNCKNSTRILSETQLNCKKKTFAANFTKENKSIYIVVPEEVRKMKKDVFGYTKKSVSNISDQMVDNFESTNVIPSDNPIYEDPRDVIGDKSSKVVNKRIIHSPKITRETKSVIKEYKRKLNKKYESLIVTLMERCEDSVLVISEKESHLAKLKEKMKVILEYNKLFSDENDQLKSQHSTLLSYVEDCKKMIEDLHVRNKELEMRNKEIRDKMKQFEIPGKEYSAASTAIPLVEVCMSCSSREIVLRQARDHNGRLQQDMHALKDVLYRLNIQLSRYQEKMRSNVQNIAKDIPEISSAHRPGLGDSVVLDSLLTNSMGYKNPENINVEDQRSSKSGLDAGGEGLPTARLVDLSGLLSAQALGPLFDAYQESIQDKEHLIKDYEKQFESMNRKIKQIVEENKDLKEKLYGVEDDNQSLRQNVKKMSVQKETLDIDRATLLERCERAESKLKEVYELYEDKMAAMMRDYETVHREYFATKSALALAEGRISSLDVALRAPGLRTVPADLHERRVDSCKRLLDDLKHQYSIDTERKNELIAKLQAEKESTEEKYKQLSQEHDRVKEELNTALKNIRLYRKAAAIFRQRLRSSAATVHTLRRSHRRSRTAVKHVVTAAPMSPTHAIDTLDKIKQEIKEVRAQAYGSLEELERRMRSQQRRHRGELQRAHLQLQHKERLIAGLLDKVADVEEVRLSQANSHNLQGYVTTLSPTSSSEDQGVKREGSAKLVQMSGGYYQDSGRETRTKK